MVESITRPRLSLDEVTAILYTGLGEAPGIVDHQEFTDGYFNAVHAVTLDDGRRLIVKVAPRADLTLLRYEEDLMATEVDFVERAGAAGVPVPRLWHADLAEGVMIMDRCEGRLLHQAREEMDRESLLRMRAGIGALCAKITGVTGEEFGYPFRDGHTRSRNWSESFLAIVDDVLADAVDLGRDLDGGISRSRGEIRALIASHAPLLDEVNVPALLHFDLWDGNVFVRKDGAQWTIEGVIDGERALWGDPLMELVNQVTFVSEEEAAAVVRGFGGRDLTDDEQRRLCLYRCYLWMLLATEGATREYPDDAERTAWALGRLADDLAVLES